MVLLSEGLGTQTTLIGLQPRMKLRVKRHVRSIRKSLLTDVTSIGSFARMGPEMLFEKHFPRESFTTLFATVRLQTGVYLSMHIISHSLIETLAAYETSVFLTVTMDLHVRAKVTTIVEVFPAFRATRREFPCTLMHATMVLVIAQLRKFFPTIGTTKWFLPFRIFFFVPSKILLRIFKILSILA